MAWSKRKSRSCSYDAPCRGIGSINVRAKVSRPFDIRCRLRRQRFDVRDDPPHRLIDEVVHLGGVRFKRMKVVHGVRIISGPRSNTSVTDVTALTLTTSGM